MKNSKIIYMMCLLGFLCFGISNAQIREPFFEVHDRGELWETMNDDGTIGAPNPTNQFEFYPSMDWPGGPHELTLKESQRSYMVAAGMWLAGNTGGEYAIFYRTWPF